MHVHNMLGPAGAFETQYVQNVLARLYDVAHADSALVITGANGEQVQAGDLFNQMQLTDVYIQNITDMHRADGSTPGTYTSMNNQQGQIYIDPSSPDVVNANAEGLPGINYVLLHEMGHDTMDFHGTWIGDPTPETDADTWNRAIADALTIQTDSGHAQPGT